MGLGDFLGDVLGSKDQYHVNDPYSQDQLMQTLNNSNQVYGQQQGLASTLLAQSQGQGPNPAQLQYQQNTQQAIQNNAGLLASQRGLNPALAARMASQNAATMQGTAGQNAAILQAQQQLASQNQLQNLYGTMGNQQLGQQSQITGANNQVHQINAGVAQQNTNTGNQIVGSLIGGAAQGGAAMAGAGGAGGAGAGGAGAAAAMSSGGRVQGKPAVSGDSPRNDTVPTLLSPGEIVIPRTAASDPQMAKEFIDHLMSEKKSPVQEKASYRSVLEAHRKLGDAIAALDKKGAKK